MLIRRRHHNSLDISNLSFHESLLNFLSKDYKPILVGIEFGYIIGKKSGIYKITNVTNGKFYIGSAVNLTARKSDHFNKLYLNKHTNDYLQKSWNLHGRKTFTFEILQFITKKEDLIRIEQMWIDMLQPFGERGYNICKKANSVLGRKHKPETIEKIIKGNTGKKLSKEHIDKIRNTKLSQNLKMPDSLKKILSDVNKIRMTGRIVSIETRLKSSKSRKGKPLLKLKGKKFSQEHIKNLSNSKKGKPAKNKKKVAQYNLNGDLIKIYDSVKKAGLSLNNTTFWRNISTVCRGKQKTAYGYKWKFHE